MAPRLLMGFCTALADKTDPVQPGSFNLLHIMWMGMPYLKLRPMSAIEIHIIPAFFQSWPTIPFAKNGSHVVIMGIHQNKFHLLSYILYLFFALKPCGLLRGYPFLLSRFYFIENEATNTSDQEELSLDVPFRSSWNGLQSPRGSYRLSISFSGWLVRIY